MVAFSRMVDLKSNGYLAVPMWMPQLLVPVGAVLMGLAAIVAFVAAWRAGPAAAGSRSGATGSSSIAMLFALILVGLVVVLLTGVPVFAGLHAVRDRHPARRRGQARRPRRPRVRQAQHLPAGVDPAVHADGALHDPGQGRRRPVRRREHAAAPPAGRDGRGHGRRLHRVRGDLRVERRHGADDRLRGDPADDPIRLQPAGGVWRGRGRRNPRDPHSAVGTDGAVRRRLGHLDRGAVHGRRRSRPDAGADLRDLLHDRGEVRPAQGEDRTARDAWRGTARAAQVVLGTDAARPGAGRHVSRRVHGDGSRRRGRARRAGDRGASSTATSACATSGTRRSTPRAARRCCS